MSVAPLSPQSALSMAPINYLYRPRGRIDPHELEQRLRNVTPHQDGYIEERQAELDARLDRHELIEQQLLKEGMRTITPRIEDSMEHFKAKAQQFYDELIALGGRPTRPIRSPLPSNVPAVSGKLDHRGETEKNDMITSVDLTSDGNCLGYRYWIEESNKWGNDVWDWKNFKQIQLITNRYPSDLESELENTDVGLVGILSKLKDWQDFHRIKQRDVYDAEIVHENCHEAIMRSRNPTGITSDAETNQENEVPFGHLMWKMEDSQKSLETSQEKLMWVESQWTEVLAEASHSIAEEPKLQEHLEDKFQKQANAIYSRLQRLGAKPSHALHPPNEGAELPQRLQHWIFESSNFTAEVWDWKVFMAWRPRVKDTTTAKKEVQEQPAQSESCAEHLEDLVKYFQYKLDGIFSWMVCWRSLARQYTGPAENTSMQGGRPDLPTIHGNKEDDDDDDIVYHNSYSDVAKAEQARFYAQQAKQKVPKAAERLERSKRELQSILAQNSQPSSSAIPAENSGTQLLPIQLPPTPPKSQSPESLPKNRRPSNKTNRTVKGDRRLKKERLRENRPEMGNTNIEQQPLPTFHSHPSVVEEAEDVEMSDVSDDPSPAETAEDLEGSECDTIMSDIEDPPNLTPPSSSESHSPPTTNTKSRKSPSSTAQASTSRRKTRSATKLDRVISGGIPKNTLGKKTNFTEQQTMALLNATNGYDTAAPVTPRRSERLKEKAETSAATSSPMSPPVSPPVSSNAVESSPSSRQKKRKVELDALESPEPSKHKKKRETQSDVLEPPESSKQKKRMKI